MEHAKESWSEMPSPVGDKTTVCLELATDGVKSSVFGDDSRVDDARIAIYDESGVLYEVLEVVDGQAKTELWCTETYWFYALANMPQVEIPATREEMLALRYRIDDADSLYARMPRWVPMAMNRMPPDSLIPFRVVVVHNI